MSFQADALALTLLAVIAVLVIAIVVRLLSQQRTARHQQADTAAVQAAIVDYFRRSGVGVAVGCIRQGHGGLIAIIESEPMKRFRLSHIIEMTVREHVRKACGLELEKIYWRFPIRETPAAEDKKAPETSDEYINEGLEHYRHLPKAEVEELPWESFEQVTGGNASDEPPKS